jgi:DNA-3-methyladenine glycosylase I
MNKKRCFGNKPNQKVYAKYHDTEWGVPQYNDQKLFEMLILEGAQAGLNWETILKKRDGYRRAFYNFDVQKVAAMNDIELEAQRNNSEIIRNKLKIYTTRRNAKVFLQIQSEFGCFSKYLWNYVDGALIVNNWPALQDIPAQTELSELLAKDLKKRGMSFVGPKIMYAYMQSVGLVNDHIASCWLDNVMNG